MMMTPLKQILCESFQIFKAESEFIQVTLREFGIVDGNDTICPLNVWDLSLNFTNSTVGTYTVVDNNYIDESGQSAFNNGTSSPIIVPFDSDSLIVEPDEGLTKYTYDFSGYSLAKTSSSSSHSHKLKF